MDMLRSQEVCGWGHALYFRFIRAFVPIAENGMHYFMPRLLHIRRTDALVNANMTSLGRFLSGGVYGHRLHYDIWFYTCVCNLSMHMLTIADP